MINPGLIQIEEILSRAVQGRTKPFLCRADDGNVYYVKGRHTGRRGQIAEWVGSRLAAAFGLPVAPCVIVEISPELIAIAPKEWQELGSGFAFGSLATPNVLEISIRNVKSVPIQLQRDLLIFDWWIRNGDRTLTRLGGNPNLLWSVVNKSPIVIDHNLAFDENFDTGDFLKFHIFRDHWNSITNDWIIRAQFQKRLSACLDKLDMICDEIPDEWFWIGEGLPVSFNRARVFEILKVCNSPQLWKVAR